ncbi:MAG: MFS transporter [Candidatus Promineifilaceae bacterium]
MKDKRSPVVFLIVFTNLLGAGVVVPTLPLYAEGQFGANAFEAAIFVAIYYVAQFIASPILGHWADRYGRRPVLIWSQVGTVISFLLFIFALPIGMFFERIGLGVVTNGLGILFFARLLDGITGGNITAAQAYIADITTEEERASALGYIHVAFASGIVFGPALGGLLVNFGFLFPFVGAAVITTISLLLTIFLLPESLPKSERSAEKRVRTARDQWRGFLQSETVLTVLALAFTVNFVVASLSSTFPLFAKHIAFPTLEHELAARNVGLMLAYIGLIAILTQVFAIKPLIKRYGEINVVIASIVAAFLTGVALTFLSAPIWITLALTPAAFGYALGIPTGESILVNVGSDHSNGQLMGLYNSVNSAAYIAGPLLGGMLYELFSPRSPFIFASLLAFCVLGLAIRLKARNITNKRLHRADSANGD